MLIAVEGCGHGELDIVYESLAAAEQQHGVKVDLLIMCGDFQSIRDENDLESLACPQKYRQMGDFHTYYRGEKRAPVLTIFIGGNHEASNYLWENYYGGWVADNIYFLGVSGVVHIGGLTICGSSGIFKQGDYTKGYTERPPYGPDSQRSIYHVRAFEVEKLSLWSDLAKKHRKQSPVEALPYQPDVLLTHDWPRGVYNHGDKANLVRYKRQFEEEVANDALGSNAAEALMKAIQPAYHFSGHLHVKFSALVPWGEAAGGRTTKFLALDKCLPGRRFLQILDVPSEAAGAAQGTRVFRDLDWLAVLKASNDIFPVGEPYCPMSEEKKAFILKGFQAARDTLEAKLSASGQTALRDVSGRVIGVEAQPWDQAWATMERSYVDTDHPQTDALCDFLEVPNKIKRSGEGVGSWSRSGRGQPHSVLQTREKLGTIASGISDARRILSELTDDPGAPAAPPAPAAVPVAPSGVPRPAAAVAPPVAAAPPPADDDDDDELQFFTDDVGDAA
eukprot:TRINITY_DN26012_c0_g1_i1.p1 TRINITY_DN26012_c0_g1~~TRINITY_DN26012_c0_g1_i1.p1  ORF type:complete len:505 (+),score=153.39 TRINITY_DN26012_c0_g1_i1:86-1600(+)